MTGLEYGIILYMVILWIIAEVEDKFYNNDNQED